MFKLSLNKQTLIIKTIANRVRYGVQKIGTKFGTQTYTYRCTAKNTVNHIAAVCQIVGNI